METINVTPIEDVWTALDLLTGNWGDGTFRKLCAARRRGPARAAYIEIEHYDSRDEHAGSDLYAVADSVVEALRAKGWVSGQKHWGYTDDNELHANDAGKAAFFALLETVATKGEREMRAANWFREVKPILCALPAPAAPPPATGSGGAGEVGGGEPVYRGHGKDRATWQTDDYP